MSYRIVVPIEGSEGPVNGVTVDAWNVTRFASQDVPAQNSPAPSGTPDAGPVTTATNGGPGQAVLEVPETPAIYNIRAVVNGITYWTQTSEALVFGTAAAADLEAEVARAEAAEAELDADLAEEVTARSAADATLASNLAAEVSRATAAETAIAASIPTGAAEAIAVETAAREAADATLATNLSTEVARAGAAEAELDADLTEEATARVAADATLTTNLSAEVTARTTGDATNATAIAAETTRAEAAEGTLTANLTAEVSRAEAAETLAAQKANNLSDLASASSARTNLGLGTAATHAATDFDVAGAAAAAITTAETYADQYKGSAAGTANKPLAATDASVTNSRTPTGTAGGDLTGTYPSPSLAAVGTAGTYGDVSHTLTITTDAKGRVTAVTANGVSITHSAITDWASALNSALTGYFYTAGSGLSSAGSTVSLPSIATAGTSGDASHTLAVTIDTYGRVTGITVNAIAIAQSQVTGLTAALATIPSTYVSTFNTRSGSVTLSKADVTGTGLTYSDVGADASGAAATVQGNLPALWTPKQQNLIASNFDLTNATGNNSLTKGTLFFSAIYLPTAKTLSNVTFYVASGGSGLTNCYVGLYGQSGSLLASTADFSSVMGSVGVKTAAFSTPYAAASGIYYLAILCGNGSTTAPGVYGPSGGTVSTIFNLGASVSAGTLAGGAHSLAITGTATSLPASISGTPAISSTGHAIGIF